jgi:hypothetical protein
MFKNLQQQFVQTTYHNMDMISLAPSQQENVKHRALKWIDMGN